MYTQTYRFIIVGILNTIVGFGVYAIYLHFINNNYLQALITSHIIGVAHSYIWNNKWTFTMNKISFKSIVRFISVYAITFFVNLLLLSLFIDRIGTNKLIGQGLALFITTLVSYTGHKYWSFANPKKS
ncbi:GtrA family protein [Paenibacillus tianjinensis]|uniref:GtrA family protein n=1 Tax=Paenibacillus tianjinensis TaxID=2810347 RepID=A0ABX7LCZ2_9BACL|nr:GtrA family protein [Paenibacillus tianjinensis]QSF44669.1 GtrA family protein [Paenibacillus tianjinensis]